MKPIKYISRKNLIELFVTAFLLTVTFPNNTHAVSVYSDTITVGQSDTLQISWSKPPNIPVVRWYKLISIQLDLLDVKSFPIIEWNEWPDDPDRVYVTIEISLPEFGDYEMYLVAGNDAGESGASNKVLIKFEEGVPGPPKEFVLIVIKKV